MASFRPTLIPTLFTIPALILLVTLGSWQLHRLAWKNDLIEHIKLAIQQPAKPLPAGLSSAEGMRYHRVLVEGEFQHDKEIFLYGGTREYQGEQGYEILTPLKTTDGRVVLIDRGWVPIQKKLAENRPETLVKGTVTIEGFVMEGEQPKLFTPPNQPKKNAWFWIDMKGAADYTGFPLSNYYVLAAAGKDAKQLPLGRDLNINIRNDHLQYAITWYSAALALLVIYILYHRKKK